MRRSWRTIKLYYRIKKWPRSIREEWRGGPTRRKEHTKIMPCRKTNNWRAKKERFSWEKVKVASKIWLEPMFS